MTCPFRKLLDINNSIKKIIKENSDNVISVTLMDDFHPARMYQMKSKKLISLDKKIIQRIDKCFLKYFIEME